MNLKLEDKVIYRGDINIAIPHSYVGKDVTNITYIKPGDSVELWKFLACTTEMFSLKMLMGAVAREYREAGKEFDNKDAGVHKDVALMKERVSALLDEYSSQLNLEDSKAFIKFYTNAIFNEYRHNYFEEMRLSFPEADAKRLLFLQNNVFLEHENKTVRSCALHLVKSLLKKDGVGTFKELSVSDYEDLLKSKLEVLKVLEDLKLLHYALFSGSKEYSNPDLKKMYAATIMPDIMKKIKEDGKIYEKPIHDFATRELVIAFEYWDEKDKEKEVVNALMGYLGKARYRIIHNDIMALINHCNKSKIQEQISQAEKYLLTNALVNRVEVSEDDSSRCNVFINFEPLLMMQELNIAYSVKQIEIDLLNKLESNGDEKIKSRNFKSSQEALMLRDLFSMAVELKKKDSKKADLIGERILTRFKNWKGETFELIKNELMTLDSNLNMTDLKRERGSGSENNKQDFFGVKMNVSQNILPVVKLLVKSIAMNMDEQEFNDFVKIKITEQAMKNDVENHSLKIGAAKIRKF